MDYNRTRVVAAGLASATALHFGMGLAPVWPTAWVFPLLPGLLYARYGDWFGWLCVVATAALLVRLVESRRTGWTKTGAH